MVVHPATGLCRSVTCDNRDMSDDALTPRQVADELGVTIRTVQRWVAHGRLAGRRVGGRLRIPRSALAGMGPMASQPPARAGIRRLLIANRGEIAARVARTANRLGMTVIGLREPDDAAPMGADLVLPVASYLDGDAILAAARQAEADAIHPGYGFLAENPGFAAAVAEAGFTWVGPPASAIAAMGDKAAARRVASGHGVPVLPGSDGDHQDDASLAAEAKRIGLPLLVKPSAGGGGKGMRVVRRLEDLTDALEAARREAARAFGDERLILERLLDGPRHVEIQVLFDAHGTGVHLGERDCSAQRRNQKIVEEAPGPAVTDTLRRQMGQAALAVAAAVGYEGAGTVEFLLANNGDFFFLEMNTRLQVEHPVTEAITGRDLVADQLRLAAGEPLGLEQAAIGLAGHAVEARLYAEDPEGGFLPAAGTIRHLRWPDGVRIDTGVDAGSEVTDRYDPMLAKVVAHAPTRNAALQRLREALAETELLGVRTNLRFLRWLLDQPVVADGQVRTDTVESLLLPDLPIPEDEHWRAAAEAACAAGLLPGGAWGGGWRSNAPPIVRLRHGDEERTVAPAVYEETLPVPVAVDPEDGTIHVDVEGQSVELHLARPPSVEEAIRHAAAHGEGTAALVAPMPGRVIAVRAGEGDRVEAHAPLVVIEAMKMEHAVVSPMAGTVIRLAVAPGQQVQRGELLAEVSAVG
jgi:acetyl-CoA/propionyl-CoA carboxylase, biotin carboxylase, biotin carboxyl carrier protein